MSQEIYDIKYRPSRLSRKDRQAFSMRDPIAAINAARNLKAQDNHYAVFVFARGKLNPLFQLKGAQ